MPRGSTAKGATHMHVAKFARHQRRNMGADKHPLPPPADFVPRNRNERRALASYNRKKGQLVPRTGPLVG